MPQFACPLFCSEVDFRLGLVHPLVTRLNVFDYTLVVF